MLKTVSTQLALASDTLSEILANGNTSGPNNIIMDAGYGINGTLGATTQATVAATTLTSTGGTFTSSGGIPLKVNMASAADNTNIVFQSAGADKWYMRHLGTSGNFSLYNNVRGAEELNIDGATGAATFAGNLVMASGSGIDFSATPGTGTSELLDDYEEGDWTATLAMTSGSVGYGAQAGKYVKVGNQVTATAWISISSVSSPSGALSVALPFVTSFSTARTGTYIRNFNLTGVTGQTSGWLNPGTAILYLTQNDNGTGSNLDGSTLQVGTELYISITYIV